MYVNLFPSKQLKKTKQYFLWTGLFCFTGGTYALAQQIFQPDQIQFDWVFFALTTMAAGFLAICIGTDRLRLKDVYFSMNPETINYRTTVYGREHCINWSDVNHVRISQNVVVFELKDHKEAELRLSAIQSAESSHQVATSLRLAAIDKNITVNGVRMQEHNLNMRLVFI